MCSAYRLKFPILFYFEIIQVKWMSLIFSVLILSGNGLGNGSRGKTKAKKQGGGKSEVYGFDTENRPQQM